VFAVDVVTRVTVGALGTSAGVIDALAALLALLPIGLVANTVNVYGCPLVNPGMLITLADPGVGNPVVLVTDMLPGVDVAVYDVIYVLLPPVSVGAVKFTFTAVPLVAAGVPIIGAAGTVNGVIALLLTLSSLVP
jgi:hypothetical protein